MANDKKLISENQMGRWAKLANIKTSLRSGMLTEAKEAPVAESEEPITEEEEEELEDLVDLDDAPEGEPGDETLDAEAAATPETVETLVDAIVSAIDTVVPGVVSAEGEAEEDFVPGDELADEGDDLGDEEDLVAEEGTLKTTGRTQEYTQTEPTVFTAGGKTTGGSAAGIKASDAEETIVQTEPTEITASTGVARTGKQESLMREQVHVVRNAIISEVARRVRARAAHEAQKQQIAESLADRIFDKLRNKK